MPSMHGGMRSVSPFLICLGYLKDCKVNLLGVDADVTNVTFIVGIVLLSAMNAASDLPGVTDLGGEHASTSCRLLIFNPCTDNFKWATFQFEPPWHEQGNDATRRTDVLDSKAADEFESCVAVVGILMTLVCLHAFVNRKYNLPLALNFPTVRIVSSLCNIEFANV